MKVDHEYSPDKTFLRSVVYYELDDEFFFGTTPEFLDEQLDVPPVHKLQCIQHIPLDAFPDYDEELFGKRFTDAQVGRHYRRPRLTNQSNLADAIINEARLHNSLRALPPPHIQVPLGCLVRENRVIGFVFRRPSIFSDLGYQFMFLCVVCSCIFVSVAGWAIYSIWKIVTSSSFTAYPLELSVS